MKRLAYVLVFVLVACAAGLLHMYSMLLNSLFLNQWFSNLQFPVSPMVVATYISTYLVWALVGVATFFLLERFLVRARILGKVLLYLAGALVWIPVHAYLENIFYALSNGSTVRPFQSIYLTLQPNQAFFKFVLYSLIFGVCAFLVYQRHYKSAKENLLILEAQLATEASEKAQHQLKSLQAQLNPHFLFNSLNSISSMVRTRDSSAVLHAIAVLGDLLRYSIQASAESFVDLREELEFTRNYIAMQKIRFGEAIIVDLNEAQLQNSELCPPFCIHTLVENGIKHSVGTDSDPISISVRLESGDDQLLVQVQNGPVADGAAVRQDGDQDNDKDQLAGTGLANLRKRLQLLYGDRATLTASRDGRRYSATLVLPRGRAAEL